MTRDKFVDLVLLHCEDSPAGNDAGEEILQEFDRLTALNAQLLEACKGARRRLTEDGLQDFDPLIVDLRIAIRAAESTPPPPPGVQND